MRRLSTALACQRNFGEAEASFFEAPHIDPENLNAHFGLGSMYLEQGDTRKAIFHLGQILSVDPASELGTRMLGNAFRSQRTFPFCRRDADK